MIFPHDLKITWFGISAIVVGIGIAYWLHNSVEPWVIETVCRELIECK
jgi:hypothetical protein